MLLIAEEAPTQPTTITSLLVGCVAQLNASSYRPVGRLTRAHPPRLLGGGLLGASLGASLGGLGPLGEERAGGPGGGGAAEHGGDEGPRVHHLPNGGGGGTRPIEAKQGWLIWLVLLTGLIGWGPSPFIRI